MKLSLHPCSYLVYIYPIYSPVYCSLPICYSESAHSYILTSTLSTTSSGVPAYTIIPHALWYYLSYCSFSHMLDYYLWFVSVCFFVGILFLLPGFWLLCTYSLPPLLLYLYTMYIYGIYSHHCKLVMYVNFLIFPQWR